MARPEPDTRPDLLTGLVKRDRLVIAAALGLAAILAWAWLVHAGLQPVGSAGGAMSGMGPGMGPDMAPDMAMAPPALSAGAIGAAFVMWLLMMIAMMLPAAAPMILIYARFARSARRQRAVLVSTGVFALCYLAVWAGFSLLAAMTQIMLAHTGAISATTLMLGDRGAAGTLLIAAGLYNFTSLRRACLDGCRSPLSFLTRYWRGTPLGVVRLGVRHGLYCLGCCWLLMSLLFVGGVMNLGWIALLALVTLAEKVSPAGWNIGYATGAVAILAGVLLVGGPVLSRLT